MSEKVAVVTGASSGIGAACARHLARCGWRVAVNYARNAHAAEEVARACGEAIAVQADVAHDEQCRRLADAALARWGRIDLLVNNAGTTKFVKHQDLDGLQAEDFESIFRLNLVAAFQMVRACAPALKAARGSVVNLSSVASLLGTGSSIAYSASKSALETMTLSLARALAPEVRVNAVSPGHVRTPWHERRGKAAATETEQRYAALVPLKSVCEPEDVADAVAWLAQGARQVTGQILYVDGGYHIAAPQ